MKFFLIVLIIISHLSYDYLFHGPIHCTNFSNQYLNEFNGFGIVVKPPPSGILN